MPVEADGAPPQLGKPSTGTQSIPSRLLGFAGRLEARPAAGWTALVLFSVAVALSHAWQYPARDWPGAFWHHENKGTDIEVPQRHARDAGPGDFLGWWTGPWISEEEGVPETRHYRPLTSTLFYLEYRLWGPQDAFYCWVSLTLHLINTALVALAVACLASGRLWARWALGAGAALLFASPWLADQGVLRWELTWWPAQMDLASLAFSLLSLLLVARSLHGPAAPVRWLAGAVACFVVASLFKETAYVTAPMAILLALRERSRWRVGVAYGLALAVLIAARTLALGGSLNTGANFRQWPPYFLMTASPQVAILLRTGGTWLVVGALTGIGAFAFLVRRRIPLWGAIVAGLAAVVAGTHFGVGHALVLFELEQLRRVSGLLLWLAAAALAVRAWRRPAVAALAAGFLLTSLVVGWYPFIYAYRQYWVLALQSVLAALLAREGWDYYQAVFAERRAFGTGNGERGNRGCESREGGE